MKSLLYIFISIVIALTLTSAVQQTTGGSKSIILQSTAKNADAGSLKQSADIISARLKFLGLSPSDVKIIPEKGQVKIQLSDITDMAVIEGLVTSKGEIAFYETYTHDEIVKLVKSDNQLFKLLNSEQVKTPGDPRVGCGIAENMKKTDAYLQTGVHINSCKFLWGTDTKNSEYCLFALKTKKDGNPLLGRSDIESVKISTGKDTQDHRIQIKLKPAAAKIFEDATRKNLNRSIAIVIDNKVYSSPVVKSIIAVGEIEVSGSFTEKEVNYFPALFNSEKLPLDFIIIK